VVLVDHIRRGSDAWRTIVDSADIENLELDNSLIPVICNESEDYAARLRAVTALREINTRRTIPAGEKDLLDFADSRIKTGAVDELTREVIASLAAMNTVKGLDLGLEARSRDDPGLQYLGNLLISSYCRNRLALLDIEDMASLSNEQVRGLNQIVSLNPIDHAVLEKLSDFFRGQGDTTKAVNMKRVLWMDENWIYRTIEPGDTSRIKKLLPFSAGIGIDRVLAASGDWQRTTVVPDFSGIAVYMGPLTPGRPPRLEKPLLACTEIDISRRESLYVSISTLPPFAHSVWINGEKVVEKPQAYRPGGFGFQNTRANLLNTYDSAVRFHSGKNSVAVLFHPASGMVHWGVPILRCVFRRLNGIPVPYEGQRLVLDERSGVGKERVVDIDQK
jgi:hypothetical protein